MAQKAAETIFLESITAPTQEAKAVMIKHAVGSLEAAGRLVEKLHLMDKPSGGKVIDSHRVEDKAPNIDQPNQLMEGDKNANRSNNRILDTKAQESHERVDAQEQTLVAKHWSKIQGGKG